MNRKISIGTTAQQTQRYGVTDPISVAEPKPEDLVSTEQLINTLCTANFFEDEDESLKRYLHHINKKMRACIIIFFV